METNKTETKKSKFGVKLLMGLMVLMVGGLAFAGVVSYLSNSVQANVTVSSPMTMTIDGGAGPVTASIYGGEVFTFTTVGTNVSNAAVSVYPTLFTLSAGPTYTWTGAEFDTIGLIDRGVDKGDVLPYLYIVNDDGTRGALFTAMAPTVGDIRVMVDETPGDGVFNKYSHPAGSAIDNNISVEFAEDVAPGTYSVLAQHLFTLVK